MTGCVSEPSEPPTIPSWQRTVEKYVWDRGNGDPNVLADMSWDDVHKGFAVIGDPLPERSIDQIGLLIGHRMLQGKPYFVFLLGTVRRQQLESLRPVALQVDGDAFRWSVGPDDAAALLRYQQWSRADVARTAPHPLAPPPFPRDGETFLISVESDRFVIQHGQSGAQWEVRPLQAASSQSARMLMESSPAKS